MNLSKSVLLVLIILICVSVPNVLSNSTVHKNLLSVFKSTPTAKSSPANETQLSNEATEINATNPIRKSSESTLSSDLVKSAINANRLTDENQPPQFQPANSAPFVSNFDRQPYEFDDLDRLSIDVVPANKPIPYNRMQNDEQIEGLEDDPQEEPGIYDGQFDHGDPDIPKLSPLNSDQTNNPSYVSVIKTTACQEDKCRSANQTSPDYHLVHCVSENLIYNCYYCPREYVLIESKLTCIGPCENEDCQKLLDNYKHVDCPDDYQEDPEDKK